MQVPMDTYVYNIDICNEYQEKKTMVLLIWKKKHSLLHMKMVSV